MQDFLVEYKSAIMGEQGEQATRQPRLPPSENKVGRPRKYRTLDEYRQARQHIQGKYYQNQRQQAYEYKNIRDLLQFKGYSGDVYTRIKEILEEETPRDKELYYLGERSKELEAEEEENARRIEELNREIGTLKRKLGCMIPFDNQCFRYCQKYGKEWWSFEEIHDIGKGKAASRKIQSGG